MVKTAISSWLKLAVPVAIGIGLSVGSASAQTIQASFTLPYEVQWGRATLPAGDYTITLNSRQGPALVRASTGEGRALVIPVSTNKAIKGQPSGLVLSAIENGYDVRFLNLREANVSFKYGLSTPPARKVAAQPDRTEAVAAQLAQK